MTRAIAIGAVVAIAAGGAATAWWLTQSQSRTHAHSAVPIATAAVLRTTLTTTTQLSGTLGYAGTYLLTPQLSGTITALPTPGAVIERGNPVYEVDGLAVYLFTGARPSWRPFTIGMSAGADVRELEQNLAALGFGDGLTIDDAFTWRTEQAVQDWQRATRQQVTGTVELGRIAFATTAVRVISDPLPLGGSTQSGQPVVLASTPDPVVTVPVPATQTYLVHRGDRVEVTVPSGATTTGVVTSVSPVAAASADTGGRSNGSNGPPQASVPATVRLDHPAVAAQLDQAPVTVTVLDRQVRDVVAVPVTSLVALVGGGYAVWVDPSDAPRRLVAVTPGLFANTLVQVTAPALHVGDRVEVPVQ